MRNVVSTKAAPGAVGPYSQAIATERFVFTSGQIPLNPETGALVEGGIEAQTEQAIKNLEAVLKAAGCGLGDVVKTTVFITNMGDFQLINGVYSKFFTGDAPARSCVQVSKLPKDCSVEIEAIAIVR